MKVDFDLFLPRFVSSFTQCNSVSLNFVNLDKLSISNHLVPQSRNFFLYCSGNDAFLYRQKW